MTLSFAVERHVAKLSDHLVISVEGFIRAYEARDEVTREIAFTIAIDASPATNA